MEDRRSGAQEEWSDVESEESVCGERADFLRLNMIY